MRRATLSWSLVLALLLLALAASLVPLFLLAPCDVPCADDFSYGMEVREALQRGVALPGVLRAAAQTTANIYRTWQGSFAAAFLMALQPAGFGTACYALTPFLMLGMLLAGTLCLCISLFSRIFGLPRRFGACVAAVLLLFSIQLVPYPVQSLYWYNGSVYYTFFYGLSLLAFALAVPTAQHGGAGRTLPLCALCFLLGGGNFVTALDAMLVFTAAVLLALVLRHPGWRRLLAPLLCLLLGFALNALAPGNAVRQAAVEQAPNALWAVGESFVQAVKTGAASFTLPVLGMLALLLLLFWHAAAGSSFSFRLPGLVTLFSFCLYAALFTPTLYALGSTGEGRVKDIVFYQYLLLLAFNAFYWTGWLRRRVASAKSQRLPLLPALGAVLLCLGCCAAFILSGRGFTSVMALGHLRSGEAAAYRAEASQRFSVLQDDSVRDAELEPFRAQPYLLFFDDISEDPADWRNESLARYFGKDSVTLREYN